MTATRIRRACTPQDRPHTTTMICPTGERVDGRHDPEAPGHLVATVHTEAALAFCLERGWAVVPAPKKAAPKKPRKSRAKKPVATTGAE